MMPLLAALLANFILAGAPQANDIVLSNQWQSITIGSDASVKEFKTKPDGRDLLSKAGEPFSEVSIGGQTHRASSLHKGTSSYDVTYDGCDFTAHFDITETPSALVFRVAKTRGTATSLTILQAPVKPFGSAASLLPARYDAQTGVTTMPITKNVRADARRQGALAATADVAFGLEGGAALIVAPRAKFLDAIYATEKACGIPSASFEGGPSKQASSNNRGYLFTNCSAAAVDQAIRYAKTGGLNAVMIVQSAWSRTVGSYLINDTNYPGGQDALKAAVAKIHAAGLLAGVHLYSASASWNDPLVSPKPDAGLLKDLTATLIDGIDEKATQLRLVNSKAVLPDAPPLRVGDRLVIGDELLTVRGMDGSSVTCSRGPAASAHAAQSPVSRLAERYGMALADLRTPTADKIAARIADVVNDCGFDMIFFDGAEAVAAQGPLWYWGPQIPQAVFERRKRDLLVQGSMITTWGWHIMSRGTSDDYAALQPSQFVDTRKVSASQYFLLNLLPSELGWWGLLGADADHPATKPEDIEHLGVRMIAHNLAVGIESMTTDLAQNGRTSELLSRLKAIEDARLAGVPPAMRESMKTGEWEMVSPGKFVPRTIASLTQNGQLDNPYDAQALRFRLSADDSQTLTTSDTTPLLSNLDVPPAVGNYVGALAVAKSLAKPEDLRSKRSLHAVIESSGIDANAEPGVLNIQIQAAGGMLRDYMVTIDFKGSREFSLDRPSTGRALGDLKPDARAYNVKRSLAPLDLSKVLSVNLRWMKPMPAGATVRLVSLEAVANAATPLQNPVLSLGGQRWALPVTLQPGEYVEFMGGTIGVYDANGKRMKTLPSQDPQLIVPKGGSAVNVSSDSNGGWSLTAFLRG